MMASSRCMFGRSDCEHEMGRRLMCERLLSATPMRRSHGRLFNEHDLGEDTSTKYMGGMSPNGCCAICAIVAMSWWREVCMMNLTGDVTESKCSNCLTL